MCQSPASFQEPPRIFRGLSGVVWSPGPLARGQGRVLQDEGLPEAWEAPLCLVGGFWEAPGQAPGRPLLGGAWEAPVRPLVWEAPGRPHNPPRPLERPLGGLWEAPERP